MGTRDGHRVEGRLETHGEGWRLVSRVLDVGHKAGIGARVHAEFLHRTYDINTCNSTPRVAYQTSQMSTVFQFYIFECHIRVSYGIRFGQPYGAPGLFDQFSNFQHSVAPVTLRDQQSVCCVVVVGVVVCCLSLPTAALGGFQTLNLPIIDARVVGIPRTTGCLHTFASCPWLRMSVHRVKNTRNFGICGVDPGLALTYLNSSSISPPLYGTSRGSCSSEMGHSLKAWPRRVQPYQLIRSRDKTTVGTYGVCYKGFNIRQILL